MDPGPKGGGEQRVTKSTRFFELIQVLRRAKAPMTAREIAETLEVSKRTVYRDIATLQAMQVPILGEAGIGYVMRQGYDLPPVNFDSDEADAVSVGLSLVARIGDPGLWRAARRAARKLAEAAPGTNRLMTSAWGVEQTAPVDPGRLRQAIREERKLWLKYMDANAMTTERTVWPLILIYYVDAIMLVAWCELRNDLRHFRLDRISDARFEDRFFRGESESLIEKWESEQKEATVTTRKL